MNLHEKPERKKSHIKREFTIMYGVYNECSKVQMRL